MGKIQILDHTTIDQIAAGEVVERPASIVKELVENAMDSGADAITVEIKDGGIEFIRVTDNGCGIQKEDIPEAFLRHATSKIRDIRDLEHLSSMGFRGEALASIASVSKVTMITKPAEDLMGYKYTISGGVAESLEEIGAPDGTTVIAAHLFYNTPVRRKFLKSPTTEGNIISELMEHLAMSRPDISYKFVLNGKTRFMTPGTGDLKEVIYRIYGKDTAKEIVPVSYEQNGIHIDGYIGTPAINRPNRNFENYFINRRYIRSDIVAKSIEEGYRTYVMQHKFPFCVLHIGISSTEIDVNVHPSKMDVRFHDQQTFFDTLRDAVSTTLHSNEMIPDTVLESVKKKQEPVSAPEPFEKNRREPEISSPKETFFSETISSETIRDIFEVDFSSDETKVTDYKKPEEYKKTVTPDPYIPPVANKEDKEKKAPSQIEMLPKERVISAAARKQYRLLGQIFDTYWLFSYQEKLYFVDQHAAHEKVNYERLIKRYREHEVYSQQCNPPLVVSLTAAEAETLTKYMPYFADLGFEIESFGGKEYAIYAIPYDLYRNSPKDLFLEILNELSVKGSLKNTPEVIDHVLATMACKAAVKGGDHISAQEMNAVLDELLTLENPYHCPHGRPTIFSMSRMELERKFKRIVN